MRKMRLLPQRLLSRAGFTLATSRWSSAAVLQPNHPSPLAACGCLGFFGVFIVAIIALNIALLIWVAKDAKNRGMDNPVLWMIVVMFTGIIGLVIYLLTRPEGSLAPCAHCANKRLPVSAKCPHCGNP